MTNADLLTVETVRLPLLVKLLYPLLGLLQVTLARLARPSGVRAMVAETLAVKHQPLIMNEARRRSP